MVAKCLLVAIIGKISLIVNLSTLNHSMKMYITNFLPVGVSVLVTPCHMSVLLQEEYLLSGQDQLLIVTGLIMR